MGANILKIGQIGLIFIIRDVRREDNRRVILGEWRVLLKEVILASHFYANQMI